MSVLSLFLRRAAVFSLALGLLPAALPAQHPEPLEIPSNRNYETPEGRAGVAGRLDRPDRDKDQKPQELVKALGIKPGDRVADIGTGVGYLLPHLSRAVGPDGVVFAEDIFPDFLDKARQKAAEMKLANVRFVQGDEKNPRLPAGEVDLAIMLDAYHHFEYPKAMLDNIRSSLKPEGRIAIVDFYKRGGMANHVRLDRDDVAKEVESYGWQREASPDVLDGQYILIFKRKPN